MPHRPGFGVCLAVALVLYANAATQASNLHSASQQVVESPRRLSLNSAADTVISPDGAHVYAASWEGIAVFARNPLTERLELIDQMSTPRRLRRAMLMSPDGAHIYVFNPATVSSLTTNVETYTRHPSTGLLTFSGSMVLDEGTEYAPWWTMSPDGAHVYVAADGWDAIRQFARDPASGALTYLGVAPTGVVSPQYRRFGSSAFTADGTHLYAYSVRATYGATSGAELQIVTFTRDASTGDLTLIDVVTRSDLGGVIALAPDDSHVYAATSTNAIVTFARDPVAGTLTFVAAVTVPRDSVYDYLADLVMAPDGTHAYLAVVGQRHSVIAFVRDPSTGMLTMSGSLSAGPDSVDGCNRPLKLEVPTTGSAIYVVCSDSLAVLEDDHTTSVLSLVEVHRDGHGALGNVVVTSPDSRHLYWASPFGTVATFAFDPADDGLSLVDADFDGIDGAAGFHGRYGSASASISPDGRHLYVGATAEPDPDLAIFERNTVSGALTFVGRVEHGSIELATSPDGKHLYGIAGGSITSFARNATSGLLTPAPPWGPDNGVRHALAIPADGRSVYLTSRPSSINDPVRWSIDVLSRDAESGALTPVERRPGGSSMVLSPDGRHAYAGTDAGGSPDPRASIRALERDPVSGALSDVDVLRDPLPDFRPVQLLASPDGQFVFARSAEPQFIGAPPCTEEIVVFRRNAGTGRLGYVQRVAVPCESGNAVMLADGALVHVAPSTKTVTILRQEAYCAPAPLAGCRRPLAPGRSTIQVRNPAKQAKGRVAWKWTNGAATASGDFGDPTTTTGQTLCIYDAATRPQPFLEMRMPPGAQCGGVPCWTTTSTAAGFRYGDRDRAWDGVTKSTLTAGANGRAKVLLKADSRAIPFPADSPMPLIPPVRVQLQADNSQCWEAVYSTAQRSDSQQFQARSD